HDPRAACARRRPDTLDSSAKRRRRSYRLLHSLRSKCVCLYLSCLSPFQIQFLNPNLGSCALFVSVLTHSITSRSNTFNRRFQSLSETFQLVPLSGFPDGDSNRRHGLCLGAP